jgi:hypothetical protein
MVLGKGTDSRRAPALHNAPLGLGHRGSSFSRTEGRRLSTATRETVAVSEGRTGEVAVTARLSPTMIDDRVAFVGTSSGRASRPISSNIRSLDSCSGEQS